MFVGSLSLAAFLACYALTSWLLHHSRLRLLVDRPNARSSHSAPTPRGGGLAIAAVTTGAIAILCARNLLSPPLAIGLIAGGLPVAAVGLWDDVRSAPIAVRMAVHLGAAAIAVYCLRVTEHLQLGDLAVHGGVIGSVVIAVAIVWALNLFNFMDGIDGIAASEAAFILFGGAVLDLLLGRSSLAGVAPSLVAGAACLGFLRWNWPPAAIFMGDIGSGYLGYTIAVIAIHASQTGAVNIYAWIILGGLFCVDATLTLCRRLVRRERIYQAHRTHAYQWLSRRWGSHARVTVTAIAINLLWLFPCAGLAVKFPHFGAWICILALAPIAAGAFVSGSGRPERSEL